MWKQSRLKMKKAPTILMLVSLIVGYSNSKSLESTTEMEVEFQPGGGHELPLCDPEEGCNSQCQCGNAGLTCHPYYQMCIPAQKCTSNEPCEKWDWECKDGLCFPKGWNETMRPGGMGGRGPW